MFKTTHVNLVVTGLLVAEFFVALDVTVIVTAVPRIAEELQGSSLIGWVFAIYTLTTCVTTPIFGKLTDLFGRKKVFAIGIVLFVLGSLFSGTSHSMSSLIWSRALQGIGAGALNPVILTIIGDLYQGERRGKMIGVISSVWSVAGLLGPLVGGYFIDQVTWRWIFYINVPIGIAALILVASFLHENFEQKPKKIDILGAVTFTAALSALMYALLNGGVGQPWDSLLTVGLFAAAVLLLTLFLWIEKNALEPMMPLAIFKIRVLSVSNISGFLAFFITTGITIYAAIWIQDVLGRSATNSGLTIMSMSIFWPLAANIIGRLMFRIGIKTSVVTGSLIVLAGTAWLTAVNTGSPYAFWIGILAVIGFGMGILSTPSYFIVQSVVDWDMRGTANAVNSLMRTLGQTVGAAVFGTIYNHYLVTEGGITGQVSGMHAIFVLLLVVAAANLMAVLFLPNHSQIMVQQKSAGNQLTR